ncbi:MAG: NADH-ubiquinone oxidoreductase [Actinomycetota bacterium]|jgi:formate hydrogenlyase subunit 3/multisubunit Na+/H+ antiporter MnhD subunit|nr:NADH-ubiquinone oxidoreductase [Actinomycetota bacterium]
MELLLHVAWPAALLFPLLLAAAMAPKASRPAALALAPLAPLPALMLAIFDPARVELSGILLGMEFGLTGTTRVFLIFTAVVWLVSAVYGRSYMGGDEKKHRFFAFFLVTMAGNLGLIMVRDLASFYLFFTLMSFAAYGLITHDDTGRARRAARVYLIMVVLGEAFLLPAVILSASVATSLDDLAPALAESPLRDAVVILALVGFGVKAGALPVHLWLPLAHPAAPTPASAVLSGTMIKAGLLGWVLFIPAGEAEMPTFGTVCLALGIVAAFYGVFVGVSQREPKSILAYSSISQMGLMTLALGVGMVAPSAWPAALLAITVYATHHALAKGALFLGVGVADHVNGADSRTRYITIGGLILAALVLAGVPLTSGALAKEFLKEAGYESAAPWDALLTPIIEVGAIGTTLLMLRFLQKAWPGTGGEARRMPGLFIPWTILIVGMFAVILAFPEPPGGMLAAILSFSALWPALFGIVIFFAAMWASRKTDRTLYPRIPEGDLLVPLTAFLNRSRDSIGAAFASGRERYGKFAAKRGRNFRDISERLDDASVLTELWLRRWTVAGGLVFTLVAAMFAFAALQ